MKCPVLGTLFVVLALLLLASRVSLPDDVFAAAHVTVIFGAAISVLVDLLTRAL